MKKFTDLLIAVRDYLTADAFRLFVTICGSLIALYALFFSPSDSELLEKMLKEKELAILWEEKNNTYDTIIFPSLDHDTAKIRQLVQLESELHLLHDRLTTFSSKKPSLEEAKFSDVEKLKDVANFFIEHNQLQMEILEFCVKSVCTLQGQSFETADLGFCYIVKSVVFEISSFKFILSEHQYFARLCDDYIKLQSNPKSCILKKIEKILLMSRLQSLLNSYDVEVVLTTEKICLDIFHDAIRVRLLLLAERK